MVAFMFVDRLSLNSFGRPLSSVEMKLVDDPEGNYLTFTVPTSARILVHGASVLNRCYPSKDGASTEGLSGED